MRDATLLGHHAEHAWLHVLLRLLLALLLILLFSLLSEASIRKSLERPLIPAEVTEAEQRLSELGYWTGPVDGLFDAASKHALIAFQKVEGRKRSGKLTSDELDAMRQAQRPQPRDRSYAHIEVDLSHQVLLVIDETGEATNILPVCTGNEAFYMDEGRRHRAHTPRGKFTVIRKIKGWRRSTLGLLFYPNYIVNGIAIHGSPLVNTYPASHGCIRIPMFAAKDLSELAPLGTVVVIYD